MNHREREKQRKKQREREGGGKMGVTVKEARGERRQPHKASVGGVR